MAIIISQEPKRSRDGTEVFFVAIDNGMWFEFEATGSPIESKCRVDVYLADNTKVNANDIVLFFGVDNKVFFDASPYIQPYLNNDNGNTYQSAVETDSNASQGFYLKYGEFPVPSPDDVATSSTYYASKSAKQFGDTYGQNMAKYWASSSQVVLAKLLTKQKTLPYWSWFPFSLSYIKSDYVDGANITQLDNTGAELSNVDYPALTDDTIEQVNILSINASTKKIEIYLNNTPTFIFSVDTSKGDGVDRMIIPTDSLGSYNCVVDWGDTNTDTITTWNDAAWSHSYSSGGIYTISIKGTFQNIDFNDGGDKLKMKDISQWGALTFNSNNVDAFQGCQNLTVSATDILDTSLATNMSFWFEDCPSLVLIPSFESWDFSSITSCVQMFAACSLFNQPIAGIDMPLCTTVANMFQRCYALNQPLTNWNTPLVQIFNNFFYQSSLVKQDLSDLDFTAATSMLNFLYSTQDINSTGQTNYDNLLVKMDADIVTGFSVSMGVSKYSAAPSAAATAHASLVSKGCTFTDGGPI